MGVLTEALLQICQCLMKEKNERRLLNTKPDRNLWISLRHLADDTAHLGAQGQGYKVNHPDATWCHMRGLVGIITQTKCKSCIRYKSSVIGEDNNADRHSDGQSKKPNTSWTALSIGYHKTPFTFQPWAFYTFLPNFLKMKLSVLNEKNKTCNYLLPSNRQAGLVNDKHWMRTREEI